MRRAKKSAAKLPKSPEQQFHVLEEQVNQTLSSALRKWLPECSWSQVRQMIESRRITVDGNLCVDSGRRLAISDVVKVLARSAKALPSENNVRVQYLDEHLVVVEKPSGITSNRHREELTWPKRRRQRQPTLDEMLPHIIAKIEGRRGRRGVPVPVRAVHRIDRETSGLLVFARTHSAERFLADQFRKHTTHRRYLAIVKGRIEEQTIVSRLVRDRGDGRRGSTKNTTEGKEAVTHVKPLAYDSFAPSPLKAKGGRRKAELPNPAQAKFTLVQCRLETGRTHQIRIHLSELGHPVCGDKVYDERPKGKPKHDKSGAPRLALHAAELGFIHPVTGKPLRFQSPLPNELADFWQRLQQPNSNSEP